MRVARLLLIAALSCGALLAAAPAAGALPAASSNSKTCRALTALQNDLDDIDPSDKDSFDQDAFSDFGDAFHKAAKQSPAKVKSALNTLGDTYSALGGSDNYVDALQEFGKSGQKYSKALTTFVKFYSTNCT
jgi:hypothetical protein